MPDFGVSCSAQSLHRRHTGYTKLFSPMSGEPGLAQSTLGEDEHLIKGPVTMWGLRPSNPKAAWGTIKLLLQRANKLSSDSLSGNK